MGINTNLVHPKSGTPYPDGGTLPPIHMTNAFTYGSARELALVFEGRAPGYAYTRIGNPTVSAFESRINELEGGMGAVACASGMSAVSLALLNILQAGDEIIAGSGLFGGTLDLFRDLETFGIHVVYATHISAQTVEPLITERTRAVFAEVIENPGLYVMDIRQTADLLHRYGLPLIVDSTTATPVLVRPIAFGADIVVHSTSKYINGSSDAIGGVIIDSGHFHWDPSRYPGFAQWRQYGPYAYLRKLRNTVWRNMGGCMSPMNAYLNTVGMETMGLRMERCCRSAQTLAEALVREQGIEVSYPTLAGEEQEALLRNQMSGLAGAILTLRTKTQEQAFRLMDSLQYAGIASNIGDVRTLVVHPASTIYLHSTESACAAAGVYSGTIRVSVGIEDVNDLIEDFRRAIRDVTDTA